MKTRESGLILPSPLDYYYSQDEMAQQVYERIKHEPLSFFEAHRPELQTEELAGDSMRYAVYGLPNGLESIDERPTVPSGEYSVSGGAIVQHLNPHKNIEQLVKNWFDGIAINNNFDVGYVPHFYFPLPRLGHSANISLKRESLAKIMQGDFTPLVDLRLRAIERWQNPLDLELGALRASGHSFDATVEAQYAARVSQEYGGEEVRAFLSEIATMDLPRTESELQEDFMGGGIDELGPLFDANRESGMESVTKAQGITDTMGSRVMLPTMAWNIGVLGVYSQIPKALSFGRSIKLNKAAQSGLASRDSAEDVHKILDNGGLVTFARAEFSKIFKEFGYERAMGILGTMGLVVEGSGHAYHDNPVAAAIATKYGLGNLEIEA